MWIENKENSKNKSDELIENKSDSKSSVSFHNI